MRIETYEIEGVEYEIHGATEMYPLKDEHGQIVRQGQYDFYDVYTKSHTLDCLICLNENNPFKWMPTKEDVQTLID